MAQADLASESDILGSVAFCFATQSLSQALLSLLDMADELVLDGAWVELGGALDVPLVELGGVWAPARALTAKVASAKGTKYVFISNLLKG